jgi:hypothetical protein
LATRRTYFPENVWGKIQSLLLTTSFHSVKASPRVLGFMIPRMSLTAPSCTTYQLAPRALALLFVPGRPAVAHAPAGERVGVNFDFRADLPGRERLAEGVLNLGLALVVIGRDGKLQTRLDLRCQKMRAIGEYSSPENPMESWNEAPAPTRSGTASGVLINVRAAEIVRVSPDLLFLFHLRLRICQANHATATLQDGNPSPDV